MDSEWIAKTHNDIQALVYQIQPGGPYRSGWFQGWGREATSWNRLILLGQNVMKLPAHKMVGTCSKDQTGGRWTSCASGYDTLRNSRCHSKGILEGLKLIRNRHGANPSWGAFHKMTSLFIECVTVIKTKTGMGPHERKPKKQNNYK